MTIHLVDGFLWQIEKSNPEPSQIQSDFLFPNVLQSAYVGKGLRHFNKPGQASTRSSVITAQKIPLLDKLVVGCRLLFSTPESGYGAYVVIHPTNVESHHTLAAIPYSTNSAGFMIPGMNILPSFVVGRSTEAAQHRVSFLTSNRTSEVVMHATEPNTAISTIESIISGVDMSASVMYEAEYDFSENKIRAYVDDIKILDFDYVFSDVEKTDSNFQLQLLNKGKGTIGSVPSTTTVECIYFANERLGPVKLEDLPLDADVSASIGFGAGPHVSKINGDVDGASFISTKESGSAKFSSSEQASGDIVAVKVTTKVRSQHRSANETYAGCQITLGETYATTSVEIPSGGIRSNSTVLDINPDTGQPWTNPELSALEVGVVLNIHPRFE